MERKEVFDKVQDICRDVFEDEELQITETMTANDVEAWDSLTHLSLINEIEETFNIVFTLDETSKSKNLGELITAVMKHLSE